MSQSKPRSRPWVLACIVVVSIFLVATASPVVAQQSENETSGLKEAFSRFLKGEKTPVPTPTPKLTETIAHFHLSGELIETPPEDPFGLTAGQLTPLSQLTKHLDKARKDEDIRAVILTLDRMALGTAQMEEIHRSIRRFRKIDKPVFVHIAQMDMKSYTMLSAASYLSVVPTGDLLLTGLYGESIYLKDLLGKLGLEADMIHMGDYKAAAETLMRTEPSPEAEANMNWLFDGLYDGMVGMIAEARAMDPARVREAIDAGPYTAEGALEAGLVDSVLYRDQFLAHVRKQYGGDVEFDNRYGERDRPKANMSSPFGFLSFLSESSKTQRHDLKPAVGIVYVEGTIQTGFSQPDFFGGGGGAYSGNLAKALEDAGKDSAIRAVVVRVDSPGGSALASEIIWNAIERLREIKPVIVSMGTLAASGGYYIACGADMIFADRLTITGSIGVVGGKVATALLWDKIGVNWKPYQRGENADLFTGPNRFNDAQRKKIVQMLEEVYRTFTGHVEAGRGNKLKKPIDEIAGGRVFTGEQALERGMIDRIGGLDDAVAYAAEQVALTDYETRVVPQPKSFWTSLFEEMAGTAERPTDLATLSLAKTLAGRVSMGNAMLPLLLQLDPVRATAALEAIERWEIIQREGVALVAPEVLAIY